MKITLLNVVLCLLISGCAVNRSHKYRIHAAHPSIDLARDTLFVISAPPEEIEIGAIEHFRDDFGTREGDLEQETLATWFDKRFLAALKSRVRAPCFSHVKMVRTVETGFPFQTYLDSGGRRQMSLRFWVPNQEALAAAGIQARYTLSVAALEFHMGTGQGRSGGTIASGNFRYSLGPSAGPTPSWSPGDEGPLTLSFIYLIWDYRANDFVAYGIAEGSAHALIAYAKSDWQVMVERATEEMLRRTPLKPYVKATKDLMAPR